MTTPAHLDEDKQVGPQIAEFPDWMRELFIRTGTPPDLLADLAMLAIPTGTFALDVAQIGGRPAGGVRTQALLDLTLFKGAGRVFLAGQEAPRVAWADVIRAQPLGFVVLIVRRDGIDAERWAALKACGLHIQLAPEPTGLGVVADRSLMDGILGELLGDGESDSGIRTEPDDGE